MNETTFSHGSVAKFTQQQLHNIFSYNCKQVRKINTHDILVNYP